MLISKYRPYKLSDLIGQDNIIRTIKLWLSGWKKGEGLLLHGPSGIGKTLIVDVIAKENKWDLIEINASDKRSASMLEEIEEKLKQGTIFKKRIVLIDEVDGVYEENGGGTKSIVNIIKESNYPVILTANNIYEKRMLEIKQCCRLLKMRRLPVNSVVKKLKEICYKEGIKVDESTLYDIAINSKGDIRAAINDLESIKIGNNKIHKREKSTDIFEVLKALFKYKDLNYITKIIENCDKDLEEIFWWVENNIANEYEDKKEISDAFEILSKADLFRTMADKIQNYRFQNYMRDMLVSISLVKKKTYHKFTSYRPPSRLVILGNTKSERATRNELYGNLGSYLHCSKNKVREQICFIKNFIPELKDM